MLLNPPFEIITHPFMGFPVISKGRTQGDSRAFSVCFFPIFPISRLSNDLPIFQIARFTHLILYECKIKL